MKVKNELKNLRIVFITHYSELYGANRSLLDLICGLFKLGWNDILLITPKKGQLVDEARQKNIACSIIPFVNETHTIYQKQTFLKATAKRIYNRLVVYWYAPSLNKTSKKIIIHSNSSATLIGFNFSHFLKVPHIWHIREFGFEDYNLKYNFDYSYFQHRLDQAYAVIAISKTLFSRRVFNCKVSKKYVIYNGVVWYNKLQQNREAVLNIPFQSSENFTFGLIGLISKEKNQLDAIEALYHFCTTNKNIQLLIAGNSADDNYMALLNKKITEYNLQENISFLGFIDKIENFYSKIDCALMCSKNEALGRVTLEAMSFGIPVIGFNNAGTSEIIIDNYNGLLYNGGAVELAEKMRQIMCNKEVLHEMRLNAIQTIEENYTIEIYAKSVLDLYKNMVD